MLIEWIQAAEHLQVIADHAIAAVAAAGDHVEFLLQGIDLPDLSPAGTVDTGLPGPDGMCGV